MGQVPTVAIEEVYVWNNTSIMQDEVLCHRLGLVPLKIDPSKIEYKCTSPSSSSSSCSCADWTTASPAQGPNDRNTVVFDLRVKCDRVPGVSHTETDPRKMYYDSNVYTGMIDWVEQGNQKEVFRGVLPRPVDPDILLVKLRPGQVRLRPVSLLTSDSFTTSGIDTHKTR